MKKINEKQFNLLEFSELVRKVSVWNQAFRDLKVGEGLLITKEEWTLKGEPKMMAYAISKQLSRKLKLRALRDGSGWAVIRLK